MPGARRGRAPLLPIESGNEEMMLPLTLEIQMRAMARTLQGQVHVAEDLPCSETRRSQGSVSQGATQAARKRALWSPQQGCG